MGIVVTMDDLLHDRRMTLTELAERIGMTLANLSILKTGKARAVRFSTLEAICDVMQCQPGDLLVEAGHAGRLARVRPAVGGASSGGSRPQERRFRGPPAAQATVEHRSRR